MYRIANDTADRSRNKTPQHTYSTNIHTQGAQAHTCTVLYNSSPYTPDDPEHTTVKFYPADFTYCSAHQLPLLYALWYIRVECMKIHLLYLHACIGHLVNEAFPFCLFDNVSNLMSVSQDSAPPVNWSVVSLFHCTWNAASKYKIG